MATTTRTCPPMTDVLTMLQNLVTRLFADEPGATLPTLGREGAVWTLTGPHGTTAAGEPGPLVDLLVTQATMAFLAANRGSLLLHSGAVAADDGRSVLVCGRSGAGKTTLTAALARRGLAYLSDESVGVDPASLTVTPWRKPLTVKPGSQGVLAELAPDAPDQLLTAPAWQVEPRALGGLPLPAAQLHTTLIVLPSFDPALDRVDVAPVTPARAALALGQNSSALAAVRPRPLAALAALVSAVPTVLVRYPDAFLAAQTVHDLLLATPTDPTAEATEVADLPPLPDRSESAPGGLRRRPEVDTLVLDGEAVLFDGTRLHHLDAAATAVWSALDGTLAPDALAVDLARRYEADPGQVRADVESLIDAFTRAGLVEGPGLG